MRLFYLFRCLLWLLKRENGTSRARWKNVAQINIGIRWGIYDLSYARSIPPSHVLTMEFPRDIFLWETSLSNICWFSMLERLRVIGSMRSMLIEKYKRKHWTWNCQLLNKFHTERKEGKEIKKKVKNIAAIIVTWEIWKYIYCIVGQFEIRESTNGRSDSWSVTLTVCGQFKD